MRQSGSERNLLKTAENQQRHRGDNGAGKDLGVGGELKIEETETSVFLFAGCRINYAPLHQKKLRHGCVSVERGKSRREGGQEEMAGDGGGSREQMSVRDFKKWTLKTSERRGTKGRGGY